MMTLSKAAWITRFTGRFAFNATSKIGSKTRITTPLWYFYFNFFSSAMIN
jgi:hypothetical protein